MIVWHSYNQQNSKKFQRAFENSLKVTGLKSGAGAIDVWPASRISMLGFESWLCLWFQLPADTHHGRHQLMAAGLPYCRYLGCKQVDGRSLFLK